MAVAAPRWNRLEHDERRAQILACARRLFSERHYGAVSTEQIALEAGVTRGLLHHYFGTKRELFLEVVHSMVQPGADVFAGGVSGGGRRQALAQGVDRWLDMVERNRGTWLAIVGAQGFGRDPEVEAILEDAREATAERLIALLGDDPRAATPALRALIRAYAGLAEAASLEWLQRGRLNRGQVHDLLLQSLVQLVDHVLPGVERARARPPAPRPRRLSQ